MAAVTFAGPYVFTTVTFTIGTTEYSCNVKTAEWIETPNIIRYTTLCGVKAGVGYSTTDMHLVGAQDWFENQSLSRYLKRNSGVSASVLVEWTSTVDPGDRTQTVGTCLLVPGNWGGEAGTIAEFDVTMPCISGFTEFLEASA